MDCRKVTKAAVQPLLGPLSARCQAATMESACEASAKPEDSVQPCTTTTDLAQLLKRCSTVEVNKRARVMAGAVGAAYGGCVGGAAGAVGALCAAAYSLFCDNTSALGAFAGVVGSIVGGAVGGALWGSLGAAAGVPRPGCRRLASDVALVTLGCATGGAIGINFHKTVGAIGAATGASFGALAARECAAHLVEPFMAFWLLQQSLLLLVDHQVKEEKAER